MIVVKAILERLVKTHETEIQEPSSFKNVFIPLLIVSKPCASYPPQLATKPHCCMYIMMNMTVFTIGSYCFCHFKTQSSLLCYLWAS